MSENRRPQGRGCFLSLLDPPLLLLLGDTTGSISHRTDDDILDPEIRRVDGSIQVLLGDIVDKRFRLLRIAIDVTVPWSVCLPVTFVHCAQTAEDIVAISSAYNSPISLRDRIKIGLHRSTPSFPNFLFKTTHPLLI